MIAPITFPGSKFRIRNWIISHFPEHRTFVEPFGGSGVIALNKPRSRVEVWNDLDPDKYNLLRVIQDDVEAFQDRLLRLKYNQKTLDRWRHSKPKTPLERAVRTMVKRRFTAFRSGWTLQADVGKSGWIGMVCKLPLMAERLRHMLLFRMDALILLTHFNWPDSLAYIDPPYLGTARQGRDRLYRCEMKTEQQHQGLADVLHRYKGKVVISHYPCDLYRELYDGWNYDECSVRKYSSVKRNKAVEGLWWNF